MNDLFDISHQNSLIIITVKEDKKFLIKQSKKRHAGCIIGINKSRTSIKKRQREKKESGPDTNVQIPLSKKF